MRSFFKTGLVLGVVAAAAWALPACSGSTTSGGGGTGGAAGAAGSGGASGAAGTAGTDGGGASGAAGTAGADGGIAGSGGSAGSDAGGAVTCGSNSCKDLSLQGYLTLPACCAGASGDTCGNDLTQVNQFISDIPGGCQEPNQPGALDKNCPSKSLMGVMTAKGCCTPSGQCGLQLPVFGCLASPASEGGTGKSCSPDGGGAGGSGGSGGSAGAAGSDAGS